MPPVTITVPPASPPPDPVSTAFPGPSGRVSTTLPIWRAWLTKRYAAEALRTSKALIGNGSSTPSANKPISSASIARMWSGPASIR
ncbi:Uncharacterised protein [Mycobacterium tuberculosis]|nr:Uncharacterised protein [Mycobacterium tuberculosis]